MVYYYWICHISSTGHLPKPDIHAPSALTLLNAGEATETLEEAGAHGAHATGIVKAGSQVATFTWLVSETACPH